MMEPITLDREFTLSEELVQAIIYAAAEHHSTKHHNADYEVCDDPVCAAAWRLEQETGVYDEYNA